MIIAWILKLLLAQTQERFCVVVPEQHAAAICDIFNVKHAMGHLYPGAGAAVIGSVIKEPLYIIEHNNQEICNLPVSAITTEVLADRVAKPRKIITKSDDLPANIDRQALALALLRRLNNTQKICVSTYDQFVKNNAVVIRVKPMHAYYHQLTDVMWGAVSIDSNTYGMNNPFVAGLMRWQNPLNIIAVGAEPIALTDCFVMEIQARRF